ncbi:MAG: glutathione S-transferase family protein [Hyphomicrobiaceae bacterium]
MILIGQYDSPFVRRAGIAMTLYGMAFEHKTWSTFGDWPQIASYNPLLRVPTLILDDGDVLIESAAILDYLDHIVGEDRAMFPAIEPQRHRALKVASLAMGAAEKGVAMFYEQRLHQASTTSAVWIERCQRQIKGALAELEQAATKRLGEYIGGDRIGHADIAVACAIRLIADAHIGLVNMAHYPALAAHCAKLEAMPVFQSISQPFTPSA